MGFTPFAKRIGGNTFGIGGGTYKFETIKQAKKRALAERPDRRIIDLGVGEPDKPAHTNIVKVLTEEAGKPANRFYADNGIEEFQEAAAAFMDGVFGVTVEEPLRQIIHGIGSKPVLALLPVAFIDPCEVILNPVPGYPVSATYSRYLEADVYNLPLLPSNGFLPDLDSIPPDIAKRAKLLYLNYPNNPTGILAPPEFFESALEFAERHDILIIHDAAYAALRYDGKRPFSIFSLPGAWEQCIEVHSLSKSFNMTGWRLAFAVGDPSLIAAYGAVKDNTDSGQFRAIQKAGAYALRHPELIDENSRRYSRRFDLLVPALRRVGFDVRKPGGTFYCYAPAPVRAVGGDHDRQGEKGGCVDDGGAVFQNAEEVSTFLIENAGISTVPWDDAGAFIRFSVTFEADTEQDETALIAEVERRLEGCKLQFDE